MWASFKDVSNMKLPGAIIVGSLSVLAIEIAARWLLIRNPTPKITRSMLSGIRLLGSDYLVSARPRYIKAFLGSIIFYIGVDILLIAGFLTPSDVGETAMAKFSSLVLAVFLPFVTMMLSSTWLPIRRTVASCIWGVLAALTILILYWKGWFGSVELSGPAASVLVRISSTALSPSYLAALNLRLGALLVSLLCSWVLVVALRYDTRFDRTVDLDYYRSHPALNKAVSVFKETVKIYVPALILGYGVFLCWCSLAHRLGLPELAPLPAAGKGLHKIPENHPYWAAVIGISLAIAIWKAFRCRHAPPEPYDIFVSYKSKNATTARQVSEQLIAEDVKAWFAEYELLIRDQIKIRQSPSELGEALIGKAIEQGIKGSRYGLAFTNDHYADSPFCGKEIRQLLTQCGPGHVLEVMIPREGKAHTTFEGLSRCPSIEYQGAIDDVLTFLTRETGWRLPSAADPPVGPWASGAPWTGASYQGMCLGRPYTLNTCGWELTDRGGERIGPGSEKGPDFRRSLELEGGEGGVLLMNLYFGKESHPTAIRSRSNLNPDDREIYDYLITYANKHLKDIGAQIRGVHLLFHGGFSQFGLTYKFKGIWTRKYSIILASPQSGEFAEFVFTFGAYPVSFKTFCRHAHLMDSVVTSLQWS